MKPILSNLLLGASLVVLATAHAEEFNPGTNDNQVGSAARAMFAEQREGVNRGEQEPYKAESAGKALRAYTDSIGKPAEPTKSQLDGAN